MRPPALDEPVIVLTSARSGSTLLRVILDAHPDLACPPETNIIKICSQLAAVLKLTAEANGAGGGLETKTRDGIHATVTTVFSDYLKRRGKIRWCDKSLGGAQVAEWFLGLYPKAKFICLYRHCMDVIYSGLEASPWGLMGYGFDQFAVAHNGNSVSALGAYWVEHTARIIEFEKTHRDRCLRVHYESLITDPEAVTGEIFSFLGVDPQPGITERCFTSDVKVIGPGDHKIKATRRITADSVGRGVQVPVGMIPPTQLKVINHLLAELNYTPVDDSWQRSACPPVLLEDHAATNDDTAPASVGDGVVRAVLENIGSVVQTRIDMSFTQGLPSIDLAQMDGCHGFGLVAYHTDLHRMHRSWQVDLEHRAVAEFDIGDADCLPLDWLVAGDVETWLGVLAERANMASCLRSGTLRYIALREEASVADEGRAPDPLPALKLEKRLLVVRELLGLVGYPEEVSG